MGAFYTNIQVHTAGRPAVEIHASIAAALRARLLADGLEEDPSLADEDAERVILLAPPGPEPWIGVYDSAIDDQDTDLLRALGETLSQVSSPAVTVLVHDSDILELRLCQAGSQVDVYNSFPDYFEDEPGEERTGPTGDPARWASLLVDGATPDTLRAAWETQDVFADDTLARLADLFEWSAERCATSCRYLLEDGDDLSQYTRLAFRPASQPSRGGPGGPASPIPLFADGPPRLVQAGGRQIVELAVGSQLQLIGANFRSAGGPGTGIRISIWGSVLDEGLLEVRGLRAGWRTADRGLRHHDLVLEDGRSEGGTPLRHGRVEDLEILRGLTEESVAAGMRSNAKVMKKTVDMMAATCFSLLLFGEALAPGSGELHVGVVPLEHPEGQTSWPLSITVNPEG